MMITGIDLKNLRNAEYIQFMKNAISTVVDNDPAAISVETKLDVLQTEVASLDSIFKTSQASEITEEIFNLDLRRDNAIVGIDSVVKGYLTHFNSEKVLAAKKISDNLSVYGTAVNRQNYQSQTATIDAIVNDWSAPDFAAALSLLGISDWKEEIATANTLFNEKYLLRTKEYAAANPDTLLIKRKDCNEAYYALRDRILAFNTIESTPLLLKNINELNALIDQYSLLLSNRGTSDGTAPGA